MKQFIDDRLLDYINEIGRRYLDLWLAEHGYSLPMTIGVAIEFLHHDPIYKDLSDMSVIGLSWPASRDSGHASLGTDRDFVEQHPEIHPMPGRGDAHNQTQLGR